ncbi:MAG TPA: hypothetical protein VMW17_03175 [Candidatus Binatia bacterium]|nr:hypothetical protein [Candidatus Binatia bacterium]
MSSSIDCGRRVATFLALAVVAWVSVSAADPAVVKVRVEARALQSGQRVDVSRIDIVTSVGSYNAARSDTGTYGCDASAPESSTTEVLTVKVEATTPLVTREVRLHARPNQLVNVDVPLQDGTVSVDARYSDQGLHYFPAELPLALCYYEYGYHKNGKNQGWPACWRLKLQFNYTRALHNTCTQLGYATCEEARQYAEDLMSQREGNDDAFRCARVDTNLLNAILNDVKQVKVRREYAEVQRLFATAKFDQAAQGSENLLAKCNEDPHTCQQAGLTDDRLHEDAGVSHLKAVQVGLANETISPDKAQERLRDAKSNLSAIGDQNPAVQKNLYTAEAIQRRLEQ